MHLLFLGPRFSGNKLACNLDLVALRKETLFPMITLTILYLGRLFLTCKLASAGGPRPVHRRRAKNILSNSFPFSIPLMSLNGFQIRLSPFTSHWRRRHTFSSSFSLASEREEESGKGVRFVALILPFLLSAGEEGGRKGRGHAWNDASPLFCVGGIAMSKHKNWTALVMTLLSHLMSTQTQFSPLGCSQ